MQTYETIDELFRNEEQETGRRFEYPLCIRDAVTMLCGLGYWGTPQSLNHAAQQGIIEMPEHCEHVSQMMLTEDQLKALALYLEGHGQWSILDPRHDSKRDFTQLQIVRDIRKELLALKAAADKLDPVELLDLVVDEESLHYRYVIWLVVRSNLERFQSQVRQIKRGRE